MTTMLDRAYAAARAVDPDFSEKAVKYAILAALDSEDEALVEAGARALWKAHSFPMPGIEPRTWERFKEESRFDYAMFRGYAMATIAAFKSVAQGETRDGE